jgi:hypothetical protein
MLTKNVIRQRWNQAIEFWYSLKPRQFNYEQIVSRTDRQHQCGTVCCLAGWMPRIDPENWRWARATGDNDLLLYVNGDLETTSKHSDEGALMDYFGFSYGLYMLVFYGDDYLDNRDNDPQVEALEDAFNAQCPRLPKELDSTLLQLKPRLDWLTAQINSEDGIVWNFINCVENQTADAEV